MEVRLSGHSSYRTEYHLIFIPKYRRRLLNPGVAEYLGRVFPKIVRSLPGVEILRQNILTDHVHLLLIIPPKFAVSEVVGRIKAQSAGVLRRRFEYLDQIYWPEDVVWSPGYFVSTVGVNEEEIMRYVTYQRSQDLGQMKLDLSSASL